MTTPLKIGILGAARIAPPAICDPAHVIPRVKLEGIAARDRDRAKAFADKHRVAQVFDSYEALINSPDIDLVYNPLPINLHAEWTIKALEAGKHVLCEKPFAMNVGEARAMLAAAEKSGKRLIEAFHYRYHPAFLQCLDWIKNGDIGKIERIEAVFNVGIPDRDTEIRHLPDTGGGAMMDLGCYPLNWALQILGEKPASVSAKATLTPRGVDESLSATLSFKSGTELHLSTSMAAGERFHAALNIHGTQGEIQFKNPLAPHMGTKLGMTTKDGSAERLAHDISPVSTYTWQLAALVDGPPQLASEGAIIETQQAALDDIYDAAGLRHLRYR